MKTIWTVGLGAVCALGLGCASANEHLGDPQYAAFNHSTVTGVISVPESAARAGSPCNGLEVSAVTEDGQTTVARAMVKETRNNRCFYQLSALPSDVSLHILVKPSQALTCENGQPLSLSPAATPVKLQTWETKTQDFQAQCART